MSSISIPGFRTLSSAVTDLVIWIGALALGVGAEIFFVLYVLHTPLQRVQTGAAPEMWLGQFIPLLTTLPILTLILHRRGENWASLGFVRPDDWKRFVRQVTLGLLVLTVLAYLTRRLIIAPLHLSPVGVVSFSGLQGNVPGLVAALAFVLTGVGLIEELQFRGFVMSRVASALGSGPMAWRASALVVGVVFGLAHNALGPANVVYAIMGGIVLGGIYLWSDRNLWVVVIVHSLFDVMRLVQFFIAGNDLPR